MSTMIFNTVTLLERHRRLITEDIMQTVFLPICDYFWMLVTAVEWPTDWKRLVMTKIATLFPQMEARSRSVQKVNILQHQFTSTHSNREFDLQRPSPGEDFFERHRSLYSWAMNNDE